MPTWASVTLFEALWVGVALFGSVYCVRNLRNALGDRRFVEQERLNGGRRIVATANVRRESLRLTGMMACLVLGLYAAVPVEWQAPFRVWLPAVCAITVVASMSANSYLDAEQRRALMVLLRVVDETSPRRRHDDLIEASE